MDIENIMKNITEDENLCIIRQALEQQEKNKKVCCKKEMTYLGDVQGTDRTINNDFVWVCGECGNIINERHQGLDDEDLYNLLSSYQDEMRNTPIYDKLKKEFEEA